MSLRYPYFWSRTVGTPTYDGWELREIYRMEAAGQPPGELAIVRVQVGSDPQKVFDAVKNKGRPLL